MTFPVSFTVLLSEKVFYVPANNSLCMSVVLVLQSSKHLSVRNTCLLRMTDDVLCVRTSPDAKYIAVALLDSTIKVADLFQLLMYVPAFPKHVKYQGKTHPPLVMMKLVFMLQ